VRTAWPSILRVIGLFIVFNVGYYVVFTYLPTYFIKTLHFTKTNAFVSITLASLVALILILPLAALSDRIGRRPMLVAGSVAFAVLGYPLFLLLNSGSLAAAIAAHSALAVIEAVYVSSAVAAGVELFATRVRYSGFSIGYNVCVAAFGGTTPYVVTWLTAQTANNVAPAYYVVVAAVVSLLTILTVRETAGRPLVQGVADETFQSEPDVRGAATAG
jgi:MHS family proline/betaine transporter-like MFS transporter